MLFWELLALWLWRGRIRFHNFLWTLEVYLLQVHFLECYFENSWLLNYGEEESGSITFSPSRNTVNDWKVAIVSRDTLAFPTLNSIELLSKFKLEKLKFKSSHLVWEHLQKNFECPTDSLHKFKNVENEKPVSYLYKWQTFGHRCYSKYKFDFATQTKFESNQNSRINRTRHFLFCFLFFSKIQRNRTAVKWEKKCCNECQRPGIVTLVILKSKPAIRNATTNIS